MRLPSLCRNLSLIAVSAAFLSPPGVHGAPDAGRTQPAATDDEAPPAPPRVDISVFERAYRAETDDVRRRRLVTELGGVAGAAELLMKIVDTDKSDDVALAAVYALRRASLGVVVGALDRRLGAGTREPAARERLLQEIERHQVFAAGQNLPHFLRNAPPVFTVKTTKPGTVRVLAFGDFGDGSDRQKAMAKAMRRLHARKPFNLAVTLGDNFYPAGMTGPADPRWESDFASLYGPMRIPFYASLGNHDWILADSPVAEILYAQRSPIWKMPSARYTFVAGPIQFFAIDTNLVTRAQVEWLERELGRSTARWKIVYGHHPVYSHGFHGDEPVVRDRILPVLRDRATIYLCGHEHDLQHLGPEAGVHFVIVGGGGAATRPVSSGPRSRFAASKNGFAVIEANAKVLTLTLLDGDLKTLHTFALGTP